MPSGELAKVRPHLALFHRGNNSNEPSATTKDRSDLCILPLGPDLFSHHTKQNCLVVDVLIIRANALQRALLEGCLWLLWILGQFSQT